MQILNSSTNKLVELSEQNITIYNCGPTVYNHVHIGNVRPVVIFDVLYRFLENQKKEITFVQNITDVDDKIINAAANDGISEKELSEEYTLAYMDILKLLNIKSIRMPKVSEHISEIQDFIAQLIDKKAAYTVDGDVYFDVNSIKDYGHISHQNPEQLLDGVRKENKSNKKSPLDFVLWKKTDKGVRWESPWSIGRPGWHTECCVLINKYIGDHVTIHGGGVDLKFPHHENENAQNKAIHGRDIADIWMHVGHINVDGSKMSKSLRNFILVKDLIKDRMQAYGLRWFFYKAKYEQPVNFNMKLFEESCLEIKNILRSISIAKTYNIANNCYLAKKLQPSEEFVKELNNDLNIPNAITVIGQQVKHINTAIRSREFGEANKLCNIVSKELNILGIETDTNRHINHLLSIKKWKQALDEKNYEEADKYRKELIEKDLL